jgi:peptidoglycan-associated lipoprotein
MSLGFSPLKDLFTMTFESTAPLSLKHLALAGLLGAALLSGCSSVKLDDTPVESRVPAKTVIGPGGGAESQVTTLDASKNGANAAAANGGAGRTVYFDYDSYALKDEYRPVVETQAKTLNSDPRKRVQVEGHTDERGGREYNLALGQKRAEVVAKALTLLGATGPQVEAVSFGKERPAAQGSDEVTWAKNRRAELNNR